MASSKVDCTGLKAAPCRNCINSVTFDVVYALILYGATVGGLVGAAWFGSAPNGNNHSRDACSRGPVRMHVLLRYILQCLRENTAVHPSSQNFPMEIKECAKSGSMCPCREPGLIPGMVTWQVCADVMLSPLGMMTMTGLSVLFRSVYGLSCRRKSSVVPVSAIPNVLSAKVGRQNGGCHSVAGGLCCHGGACGA